MTNQRHWKNLIQYLSLTTRKARNIYILLSHLVHDYMSCFPVLVLLLPIKTSFPELVRHQTCRMGTCLHAAPVDGLGVLIGTCLGTMNEWKAVSNTKKQNSVLFAASDQNIPMLNTRLSLLTRFSTNSKLFKYSKTFVILNCWSCPGKQTISHKILNFNHTTTH